jgi:hypothetical protein
VDIKGTIARMLLSRCFLTVLQNLIEWAAQAWRHTVIQVQMARVVVGHAEIFNIATIRKPDVVVTVEQACR